MNKLKLFLSFTQSFLKMLSFSVACLSTTFVFSSAAYAVSFSLSGTPDISTMLINFSQAVPQLMRLVTAMAFLMGFYFVIKGVIDLKQLGEARSMMSHEHSFSKPLIMIAVGVLLVYLPSSVRTGISTFWTEPSPYSYVSDSSSGNWTDLISSSFLVIQLIGTIAFIRGLVLLTQTSGHGQPGTFAKAMSFIVAGILCINLYQFLDVIFATFGLGSLSP